MKKILLTIFKKKSVRFLFIISLLYLAIFNKFSGQIIFDSVQTTLHSGTAVGNVESFSLFYGIEISDFTLSPGESGSLNFFTAERIQLHYNLPLLLIGRIKLSDISLINPKINIIKKGDNFNFETIFPPGRKKENEEPGVENNEKDFISTYVPVSLYYKVNIQNLELNFRDENIHYGIKNFNFYNELDTKRFTKIPLDYKVFELIDFFVLQVQKNGILDIIYNDGKLAFNHPFILNLELENQNSKDWKCGFKIGFKDFLPTRSSFSTGKLNFLTQLAFNIKDYSLLVEQFYSSVDESILFNFNGNASDLKNINSKVKFEITESDFDLSVLDKYRRLFDSSQGKLGGKLKLFPMKLEGVPESLRLEWKISGSGIDISYGKESHKIPNLFLNLDCRFGVLKENNIKIDINSIHSFSLMDSKIQYDNSYLQPSIFYANNQIQGNIKLTNFNLNKFIPSISGLFDTEIDILPSTLNEIIIKLKGSIHNFQIPISNGNTKPSELVINIYSNILLTDQFSFDSINISNSEMLIQRNINNRGLNINLPLLKFSNKTNNIELKSFEITPNLIYLSEILPLNQGRTISDLRPILGEKPAIKGDLYLDLNGKKILKSNLYFKSGGSLTSEFNLTSEVFLNFPPSSITISKFTLSGFENSLLINVNGSLSNNQKNKMDNSHLKIQINMDSSDYIPLLKNIQFYGKISSVLQFKENIISGNIESKESYFKLKIGNCPGEGCKYYDIVNINFDIPFEHYLNREYRDSILEGNKTEFLKGAFKKSETNFTIDRISGSHPTLEEKTFLFANGTKIEPGITTRLEYKDNRMMLSNLNLRVLSGNIISKSIIFQIGKAEPEKIEFLGNVQVRDLDLTELLTEEAKKNIDDGKIRGDINFAGKNLKDPINNTEVYFSIYRIGKDFGKSAINVVSPPNLIRDYIVNSYSVDKIEAELSRGLVYITILFKQGLLSNLLTKIDNNKISQERMPLNNFLNRAQDEISTYNR